MTVDISSLKESYKQISEASSADAMLMGKVGVLIKEIVSQELGYEDYSEFRHVNASSEALEELRDQIVEAIQEMVNKFVKEHRNDLEMN